MACTCSPTRTRAARASNPSGSTVYDSRPPSYGARIRAHHRFTSTVGSPISMSSDKADSLPTSNAAKIIAPPELHDRLPALPHDEEGPVFATPWEAQAFALA